MRASRGGMTLLEVVVALTVAGAALATGATVLGFLADQKANVAIAELASAAEVRSELRYWISHARLTTEGDAEFRGSSRGSRSGSMPRIGSDNVDDELTFVTNAETVVSSYATQVHIYVSHDTGGMGGIVADLTPFRSQGHPVTIAISREATGLHIRYLGSLIDQRVWQPSWVSTSVLPVAAELRIISAATQTPRQALLVVPMRIALLGRQ